MLGGKRGRRLLKPLGHYRCQCKYVIPFDQVLNIGKIGRRICLIVIHSHEFYFVLAEFVIFVRPIYPSYEAGFCPSPISRVENSTNGDGVTADPLDRCGTRWRCLHERPNDHHHRKYCCTKRTQDLTT